MSATKFLCVKPGLIGGGDPFYLKFWVKVTVLKQNRQFSIFTRSALAITPIKNSPINTNRKSTMRFPMSPIWTSHVVPIPPKGAQKRKTVVFCLKSHFAWRKSATMFLYVKTVSNKVVGHSLTMQTMQKWLVGDTP